MVYLVIPEGKPLTFSGQSYVRWRLNEPMQRRFTLALEVRTLQKSARLMHAVGRVDYSLLEVKYAYYYGFNSRFSPLYGNSYLGIGKTMHHFFCLFQMVNGAVQYRFDCGSGEGLVRVDSIRINDGQWHRITVERRGRTAEVTIDDKASTESTAPGTNDLLNLDRYAPEHSCKVVIRMFIVSNEMQLPITLKVGNKLLQVNPSLSAMTCTLGPR